MGNDKSVDRTLVISGPALKPYKPTPTAPIVPPPPTFADTEASPKRPWASRFKNLRENAKQTGNDDIVSNLNKSVNRVQFEDDLPDRNTVQKHLLHSTPFVQ